MLIKLIETFVCFVILGYLLGTTDPGEAYSFRLIGNVLFVVLVIMLPGIFLGIIIAMKQQGF